MLKEHLDNMIKRMNKGGQWYAQEMCYKEKATTQEQGFILGFTDACTLIQRYIKQYHIDKKQDKCYTSRKAHKK